MVRCGFYGLDSLFLSISAKRSCHTTLVCRSTKKMMAKNSRLARLFQDPDLEMLALPLLDPSGLRTKKYLSVRSPFSSKVLPLLADMINNTVCHSATTTTTSITRICVQYIDNRIRPT